MNDLTIDNIKLSFMPGQSVLEVAAAAGIEIPTLCFFHGLGACATCMVCAVADNEGKFIPACSTAVVSGMAVDASSPSVIAFRRRAIELLLAEHRGDCEAPCHAACPFHLDIAALMAAVPKDLTAARAMIEAALPLPEIVCSDCRKNCEKVCRRRHYDQPVAIATVVAAITAVPPSPRPVLGNLTVVIAGPGRFALAAADSCRHFFRTILVAITDGVEELAPIMARLTTNGVKLVSLPEATLAQVNGAIIADAVISVQVDDMINVDTTLFAGKQFAAIRAGAEVATQLACRFGATTMPVKRYCHHAGNPSGDEWTQVLPPPAVHADTTAEAAARCLQCGCTAATTCKLRKYADVYHASGTAFKPVRPPWARQSAGNVIYESGKCIRCGICVKLGADSGAPVVPVFIGKGITMTVGAPFGHTWADIPEHIMNDCVRHCPTGALSHITVPEQL